MNIALSRLIGGIIATIRTDVVPHVSDPYARGQAVGVIDLLNNLAPRVEWAAEPLCRQVEAKRRLLAEVAHLAPQAGVQLPGPPPAGCGPQALMTARGALDAEIGDVIARLWPLRHEAGCAGAIALIRAHLHDEAAGEMKKTRKPLFAEIASGGDATVRD